LFIVVQGVYTFNPASKATCLAGAWPNPAEITLPKTTSSTYLAFRLMDYKAPLTAKPPSLIADRGESFPKKEPIGVLLAATI
jgi:hypothetical protein